MICPRTQVPTHQGLRIMLAFIDKEELLVRNGILYPEVSFTFWQLNTLNACEACSSCSDHYPIRRAIFVLPTHL